jgi:hypothetical protein
MVHIVTCLWIVNSSIILSTPVYYWRQKLQFQSKVEIFLMSYKFTSSQEYFDKWVHWTYDTLDCRHDLLIKAIHNTASHIYLRFHVTIEKVKVNSFGVLDSIGSNVLTWWHVPWTWHVYTPSRTITVCSSIPGFSVSVASMNVKAKKLL